MRAAAGKRAAAAARFAATQRPPIQAVRVPAQVMQLLHIVAAADKSVAAVVDMPAAAAVDMKAAVDAGNL
jgi:hypothetical protein